MSSLAHLLHHTGVVNLRQNGVEERVQLHGPLLEVERDGAVVELHVRDLLHDHLELVMSESHGAVGHHRVRGRVVLVVVGVEVHCLLPEEVALAGMDELGDVELRGVHLDEIHKLLRLVLCIQDAELCVHADVRALAGEAGIQEADKLLEVAPLLVVRDELLQMVGVHDDVHAGDLGAAELLRLDARDVDLLPGLRVVGLLRRLHGLGVLAQHHVAGGELGVVRNRLVQDLRGLVCPLLVEAIADGLGVGRVRAANKLLHVPEALTLRVGVYELTVDDLVLLLVAGHQEEPHKLLVVLLALRGLDHLGVVGGVLGLQVGLDGLRHLTVLQLRLAQLVPDSLVAAARRELLGPLHGLNVRQQRVHGLGVHA
mmetsp:Transcript_71220/g.201809  ORF Transcript_71220/g.201809 Transcript_71220/m.201809 type:complete len:370 (+) Transcript_71220:939-2048(+)